MGRLAKSGGSVLVMDERMGEEFGNVGDPIERLLYGFSLTVCLPDGMPTSRRRLLGRSCGLRRSGATRSRPGSAMWRSCRWSTTCSGSTGSSG